MPRVISRAVYYFVKEYSLLEWQATCKRTQQLPTLVGQQRWKLLRPCWQWCANGCNNSQQCLDLQCSVGRIQAVAPKNVGGAVQTDPKLLRYASVIKDQKRWEILAKRFHRFKTLRNHTQQHATRCANGRNM